MFSSYWQLISIPFVQTIQMVLFSTVLSVILGLPIGVLLYITDSNGSVQILPMPLLNNILSRIVNILRSFPFIILMILIMPLSRLIIGTAIGTKATIIPLSIAAAPFVARLVESALKEVTS